MPDIINNLVKSTKKTRHFYLNGGCYVFGKLLQEIVGGDLIYLVSEYHFVLRLNNKLYDASGNVTNKYKSAKFISEQEFLQRDKLVKSILF